MLCNNSDESQLQHHTAFVCVHFPHCRDQSFPYVILIAYYQSRVWKDLLNERMTNINFFSQVNIFTHKGKLKLLLIRVEKIYGTLHLEFSEVFAFLKSTIPAVEGQPHGNALLNLINPPIY